jgi:hypothetical protein
MQFYLLNLKDCYLSRILRFFVFKKRKNVIIQKILYYKTSNN